MGQIEQYRAAERRLWDTVGLTPEESFVTLPRLGVDVRVQELGSGEPILFIHGGPNAGSTWAPIVGSLEGFRCILVDRPGTGLSQPYRVDRENLADYGSVFVGDLADGVGLETAHVVASSFGGYLAIHSAAREPGRVRSMVQMACPALAPGMKVPPFMRLLTVGAVRKLLEVLPPNPKANRSILRQIGHGASLDAGGSPNTSASGISNWGATPTP
jgi:2-hydroxy-6-oxonona-2,4-dienedioate hydrolase